MNYGFCIIKLLEFYATTVSLIKFIFNIKGTLTDILKNGVSKSIVHMIKYADFQLYRVHHDGVI